MVHLLCTFPVNLVMQHVVLAGVSLHLTQCIIHDSPMFLFSVPFYDPIILHYIDIPNFIFSLADRYLGYFYLFTPPHYIALSGFKIIILKHLPNFSLSIKTWDLGAGEMA